MPEVLKYVAVLMGLVISSTVNAIPIGDYPGLAKLIDMADAIVILRIERRLSDYNAPPYYSIHECMVYQSLKGDIPAYETSNSRIHLQLIDPEFAFTTPFAHGSSHLMFLSKKTAETGHEEGYYTLNMKGAYVPLSPLGNEKMPEGDTLEEKVRNVIKGSIEYENQQHEKKQTFLKKMLGESGNEGAKVERVDHEQFRSCHVTIEPVEEGISPFGNRYLLTFLFGPYDKVNAMEPAFYMHGGIAGGIGLKVRKVIPDGEAEITVGRLDSGDDRGKIIKISSLPFPDLGGYGHYDFFNGRDGRKVVFQQYVFLQGRFPSEEGLYAVTYEHPWQDVEGTNVKFYSDTLLVSVMSSERWGELNSLFKDNPKLELASYQMKHPMNCEFAKYRRPLEYFDEYIQVGMPYDEVLFLMGSPDWPGRDYKSWGWDTSPVGGFWIRFEDGKVTSKGFSFDRERP